MKPAEIKRIRSILTGLNKGDIVKFRVKSRRQYQELADIVDDLRDYRDLVTSIDPDDPKYFEVEAGTI